MFEIENEVDVELEFSEEIDDNVIGVVDMDEQCFIVAAACEERLVEITNINTFSSILAKNRTEFKKFMVGVDHPPELFEFEDIQKAEKLSHAINTLKRRLENIRKMIKCSEDKMEYYISGKDNFRDKIPLAAKYKGNREDTLKPVLLMELRDYCINYLDAVVVDGMETDDRVCIRVAEGFRNKEKIIGISQDKDGLQVSGWWFNYEKDKEPQYVNGFGELYIDTNLANNAIKGYGRKFLYYQLLHEDKADNYSSRDVFLRVLKNGKLQDKIKKPRFGDMTAYKLLGPCENDKECLEVIIKQYKKWYGEKEFEYMTWNDEIRKATWLDVLDMQFQCAYMYQKDNDKNNIRKILKKVKLID